MTDVADPSAPPQPTGAGEARATDRDAATTDEAARRAAKGARRAEKAARRAARDARRAEKEAAREVRREQQRAERAERKALAAAERAVRRDAKRAERVERKAAKAERKAAKAERKAARAEHRAQEAGAIGEAIPRTRPGEPVPVMAVSPSHRKVGKQRRMPAHRDAAHVASAAARGASRVLEEVAGLVRQAAEPAAAAIVRRASGDASHAPPALVERPAESRDAPATPPRPLPPTPPRPQPASPPGPTPAPPAHASATAADASPALPALPPSTAAALPSPSIAPAPPVRVEAAIDIGSNSVHLLVAVVAGHRLEPLVDESVFLGLGDRVREHGTIGSESRRRHVEALRGYVATARQLGATGVAIVGTEPVRRAADAARLVVEVEEATGTGLHVLDHAEEGILTLIGVTGGRKVVHDLVVVDVGGGSSEFVVVGPDRPPEARGLRVGSASLTAAFVNHDPPSEDELASLAREARRLVADAPTARPRELVAVGGTASNLARLVPAAALERSLTSGRIATARSLLLVETAAEAAARHAVNPVRARLLPAGAAIVEAVLEHYGANRIRVSEAGVREGAVLAMTQAGPAWRDQLGRLAVGWRG